MMQYVLQAPTVWHSFLAPGLPISGVTFNGSGAVEVKSTITAGEGKSVSGSWEEGQEDRARVLADGRIFDDATIREMSTMSFV